MFTQLNVSQISSIYLRPKFQINTTSSLKNKYYEMVGLSKRLYIQIKRRPSNLIAGLMQPLIWLIFFNALFQKTTFNIYLPYSQFLNTGLLIFTAFNSAMNSGLPIIFDREFGFLNRLLISPLSSKYSILISSLIAINTITLFQAATIYICNMFIFNYTYNVYYILSIIYIIVLFTSSVSNISICLAFILPGHIEFLAFILIINLPVFFSSTALAPLSFMPYWLKVLACLNPMTYAIEILRYIAINNLPGTKTINLIREIGININTSYSLCILILINILNFILSKYIITYKCE